MKLRAAVRRMLCMCPDAWYIFIRGIQLCCVLLFCAALLLIRWDGSMMAGYEQYKTAGAIVETTQALLLITGLFSVCIEDLQS